MILNQLHSQAWRVIEKIRMKLSQFILNILGLLKYQQLHMQLNSLESLKTLSFYCLIWETLKNILYGELKSHWTIQLPTSHETKQFRNSLDSRTNQINLSLFIWMTKEMEFKLLNFSLRKGMRMYTYLMVVLKPFYKSFPSFVKVDPYHNLRKILVI